MKNMIRFSLLILLSLFVDSLHAQTLTNVRVFFDDSDNGYQYFALPGEESIDQPFDVDVSALSEGVHRLYIQVEDQNGRWSLYDSDMIQIIGGADMATLNAVEYFFNTDPGMGEGIQIAVSGTEINTSFDLNLDGLSNGIHQLYIRVRDGDQQWSLYAKKIIHVVGSMMQELVAAEYFFDADPGLGSGNTMDLTAFAGNGSLDLSAANLSTGVHTLYLRVLDAEGIWSLYDKLNVVITNPQSPTTLVMAEYYFDTDPGEGNATPLVIPQEEYVNGQFQINIPADLTGTHSVCIRVLNGSGEWSDVSCETFTICNMTLPSITETGEDCSDQPHLLSIPSGVYDTILWSTDETSSTIEITTPGEYTVTVTDNGCTSVATFMAEFEIIEEVIFELSGSICEGDVQQVSITNTYDSYLWEDGSETSSIDVTNEGTYQVQVTQGTCTFDASIFVDYYTPTNPVIMLTGSGCEGDTQVLALAAGYTDMTWSTGAIAETLSVTTPGEYGVTALDQGCPVASTITVSFDSLPTYELTTSGSECEGEGLNLSIVPDSYTYLWSTGSEEATTNITTSGVYTVDVMNGECISQTSYNAELISLPVPNITANNNTLACDLSGYTYQWYFNGNIIDDAASQFYQTTQSGFYTVEISSAGCSETSAILNHTYIGIDLIAQVQLRIYPNPVVDLCTIESSEMIQRWELTDVAGKVINTHTMPTSPTVIDMSTLASGGYFIKVFYRSGMTTLRVMKE